MDTMEVGREEATRLLDAAGGHVKTAIVMARLGVDAPEARSKLEEVGGSIGALLTSHPRASGSRAA
jgi:N-acetylmuramic acid 6-phosphate etherase